MYKRIGPGVQENARRSDTHAEAVIEIHLYDDRLIEFSLELDVFDEEHVYQTGRTSVMLPPEKAREVANLLLQAANELEQG